MTEITFDLVPVAPAILAWDVSLPPMAASLNDLYRREETLHEHRATAVRAGMDQAVIDDLSRRIGQIRDQIAALLRQQ